MKMKLTIPNQEDITVEQYQLIEKCYIDNGDNDFSDKFLIKTIFGLSFEQIDSVKQSKLTELITSLRTVINEDTKLCTTFILDGVNYGFIPNLDEITVGEYADLEKYLGSSEDYNKALAVLFRPVVKSFGKKYTISEYKGTGETAEIMKRAPFKVLKGALVFFCDLERELLGAMTAFITKKTKAMERESARLMSKSSLKDGAGLQRLSDYLAEITLESKKLQSSAFMKH